MIGKLQLLITMGPQAAPYPAPRSASLIGGVLLASAMVLGGCVAPAGDDDLDQASAALVIEEEVDEGLLERSAGDGEQATSVVDSVNDGENDPQPNPWVPTANTHGPPGPNDPGPSPLAPKGR